MGEVRAQVIEVAEPYVDVDVVGAVALRFVAAGRVVPGVSVDGDGRVRSWWWPLPTASDRAALASLVSGANDVEAHRRAADQLADEVDARVRERLAFLGLDLVGRLGGRRSLPEVWLRSLTSLDPWLPESTDAVKATALASEIADWVRGALAGVGVVTVQLRVVEPAGRGDRWMIEPLVTDVDESSLVLPLSDALGAGSPFPARRVRRSSPRWDAPSGLLLSSPL